MMTLLIDEYKKRLVDLDEKLEKIQLQMMNLKSHPLYSESEQKLKIHLEQFNKISWSKKTRNYNETKRLLRREELISGTLILTMADLNPNAAEMVITLTITLIYLYIHRLSLSHSLPPNKEAGGDKNRINEEQDHVMIPLTLKPPYLGQVTLINLDLPRAVTDLIHRPLSTAPDPPYTYPLLQ